MNLHLSGLATVLYSLPSAIDGQLTIWARANGVIILTRM
jgi:hypothetical protein